MSVNEKQGREPSGKVKLISNRQAWGMVPRKDGEAMNQTEPKAQGSHDNPVSGSHPPGTVTLTSQWKHKCLPHSYQSKSQGQAGNKITVRAIRKK